MAELVIAPGKWLDITSQVNRSKFHTSDPITGQFWPVSLGKTGSTPFGSKPTIYCTGGPSQFKINRATGRKLSVYGELIMLDDPP